MMGRSVKIDDVINLVPEGRRSWMEKRYDLSVQAFILAD